MPDPKFPSAAERESIMKELEAAAKSGKAAANSEHFKNYSAAVRALNALMDEYSQPKEPYGIPKALTAAGKKKMLDAIVNAAKFGETFLADAERNRKDAVAGADGIVARLQQMLSADFEMLSAYDPKKAQLSFLELQENARTQIIDFRGQKLPNLTGSQSSRIPMTVVDAAGNRRRGVFTRANRIDIKGRFNRMLDDAAAWYDSEEFKKFLPGIKEELFYSKKQPGFIKEPGDIQDETVIREMKDRVKGFVDNYRSYLKNNRMKVGGEDAKDASDELIISKITELIFHKTPPQALLEAAGLNEKKVYPKVFEAMKKGLTAYVNKDSSVLISGGILKLKDGDRVDQRNSAMSAVAALLGKPGLIVRSNNMKYLDENGNAVEGTFTDYAEGLDLFSHDGAKYLRYINDRPFAPPCGITSSLADLQVLDYICGNVDRHGGNLTFLVDKDGGFIGVQGIDNDSAFGHNRPGTQMVHNRLLGTDHLQVITREMADKVNALTPDMLRFALRGRGLSEQEIKASCDRLADLKTAIRERSKTAKTTGDVKSAGKRLCIMEKKDLDRVPFNALATGKANIFTDVKLRFEARVTRDRANYPYRPGLAVQEEDKLTEVSTADRKYVAGGIADSMNSMSRAIKNEITGFKVGDLSEFLRSSGKFRDMVKAVKEAKTVAGNIRKEIGEGKETLDRNDPAVAAQMKKANDAMGRVRTAVEAYLAKKMTERHVDSYEALRSAGKNPYEQKRINYALGLMDSVKTYEKIGDPNSEKQEKELTAARVEIARKRKAAKPEPEASALQA